MNEVRSSLVSVGHNADAYFAAREALERLDLPGAGSANVLIKPNAGRCAQPGAAVTTSPQVVAAVIDYFRERGAENLSIGESPITGVDVMEAFEATGIADVARERDIELIDMDASRPVDVEVPGGEAIRSLSVCPHVLAADYVVSVPVMKTHMHTQVTLSVKNMKGGLWRRSKVKLHQLPPDESGRKSLDVAIADLATVLRPDLTVIDGTIGMEGLGPSAGAPRRADVVIAGTDPVACDATAVRLMGFDPSEVVHLVLAAERGVGSLDGDRVEPADYLKWRQEFRRPPEKISIEWPNIVVHDCGSCSACMSTVMLFLKRYSSELADYRLADGNTHLAMGKGNDDLPEGTVLIGNCTAKHEGTGKFVPGCPPVASHIFEIITGKKPDGWRE